ncbi:MAG: peptide ABC transporter substrate-binding protein [Liquorilactobacillus nagelii]|jgi:oligopeptide transport system substrate-binding protein|uniref:peptide ABC transporter substrate-binding protein n=1 Tax=Liquorilactobacillus nagelii TaxID=82688 RepID=UPI001CC95627|nr:peptide ABC transporter substrate-binding protein [Liquorilactobacillus nagelii]MCI1634048.1 peptide ABC transporter substrate-binding protein [Liquorilactobacillus nagelii]MCI1921911.1 peptide ABC transporter substrate-binding protein [Liquorilactobacillus nagelii]MCI1976441.1 peptide ABC transporter substrate-binding protein [Liquorilactobacillus nagelii]ULQ50215.1 peptide ABC transporter substrate-binding protein [Liquorilactobacillus nagelii]
MGQNSRKKYWWWLAVAAIVIVGLISWQGITKNKQKSTTKATKQTINLAASYTITSLDVAKITDRTSFNQIDNVGEGLYQYDKNGNALKALAIKTKVSKNKRIYTINIRKNTKWSNGDLVTAKDFVYSWQHAVNPKTASQYTYLFTNIKNADQIIAGKKAPTTLGVKATGKYQLKIWLNRPQSYFTKILARETLYPIDQRVAKKYGSKYGTSSAKTVYNGPFVLTGWNGTNDTWQLKKNSKYWDRKKVKLSSIKYQVVKDPATAYNLYKTNKLDLMTLTGDQIKQLANNKDVVKRNLAGTEYLEYNVRKNSPVANKDVRLAISLALNRKELINNVLQNDAKSANSIVPSNFVKNPQTGTDYTKEVKVKNTTSYNLELAKKLFKKGLQQLNKKELTVTLMIGPDDSTKKTAEFIQSQLETHLKGLTVQVKTMPVNVKLARRASGDFDLDLIGWTADFADPITFLQMFTSDSTQNHLGWSNAKYDSLINNANQKDAGNVNQRWSDLVKAGKVLNQEQPITPLYEMNTVDLVNSHLKNIVYDSVNGHYSYKEAYLSK